uniref:tetrahydrofolate synthase n=1 Tax=Cyprinodon variegatus TaxID=28743 RepID=A0A3Q2DIN5_CYPVA
MHTVTLNAKCSPHLVQVRERIRINGQPISKDLFTKYFWQVYGRLDETKEVHGGTMPAYFRFLTILAFHIFLQEKVDLAVIEVGIGGAYDCTNIIRRPWVCGISSLGIDHTQILGDTIEKIAWQKGGIFKVCLFWIGTNKALLRAEHLGDAPLTFCLENMSNLAFFLYGKKPDYSTQVPLNPLMCFSGAVVRVLLFNATGERDSAAMLKLLVPCHFDFAVFCPNITEAVASCNADQQNFNVSVENMLTRCLDNERSWRLHSDRRDQEVLPLLIEDSLPLLTERKTDTLVFPCILSALQWITQGRDPVLTDPAQTALPVKPSISARAAPLRDAAEIHVLVTGSLHLVGGVLKHLDPEGTAALNSA